MLYFKKICFKKICFKITLFLSFFLKHKKHILLIQASYYALPKIIFLVALIITKEKFPSESLKNF